MWVTLRKLCPVTVTPRFQISKKEHLEQVGSNLVILNRTTCILLQILLLCEIADTFHISWLGVSW